MKANDFTPTDPFSHTRLHEISELLTACEAPIQNLIEDHKQKSKRWFAHEILPWGEGQDFTKLPWAPEQCPLDPAVALAFETNLLTEDNLPFYHAQLSQVLPLESCLMEWSRIWTSEEALHSIAMRDYAHLMRVLDPVRLETNRVAINRAGFDRVFRDPLELFAYTTVQEVATRVSHLKLGQKSGEPILAQLMALISRDENFHFIFYRSLVKMALDIDAELVLPSIMNQVYSFEMPGTSLEDFDQRQETAASLGVYGALEHRDLVVNPVLKYWEIDKLRNLNPRSQEIQERILKLPLILDRIVERQQPRTSSTLKATESMQ